MMKINNQLFTFIEHEKKREPEKIVRISDENNDLEAFLAIDTLQNGQSSGGLRITDSLSMGEIKTMARSMTLKYNFLRRVMGGAKCGILLPKNCTLEEKKHILKAFGTKAEEILKNQTYIPYMDINCSVEDIYTILKAAHCTTYKVSDSSYFTALTVVSSIKAACEFQELDIKSISVIIEGFGNVGSHIARELEIYGATIVGVSTQEGGIYDNDGLDIKKLINLRNTYADNLIHHYPAEVLESKEQLLEKDADILIPCARSWSIHKNNMRNIKASIIVPGANNPYGEGVEEFLLKNNVLCLPDFVCNIGGILGSSLFDQGLPKTRIYLFIMNDFSGIIKEILRCSDKINKTPYEIAFNLAQYNHFVIKQSRIKHQKLIMTNTKFLIINALMAHIPSFLTNEFHILNEKRIILENLKVLKKICSSSSNIK